MNQVEAVISCFIVFISIAAPLGLIGLIYKFLPERVKDRIDKVGEPKYIEMEDE